MAQFSLLQAIFYAPFSAALYRDVFLRWQGLGMGYLLVLNALLLTPVIAFTVLSFERNVFDADNQLRPHLAALVDEVSAQLPELVFENGQMQTQAEQPLVITITAGEETQPFAVIDVDGGMKELRDSGAVMLLSRDAVFADMGDGKIEARSWSDMGQERFVLNSSVAREWADRGVRWTAENKALLMLLFGTLLWVGTLLVMFLYRALQAVLLGIGARLIARSKRLEMRFGDAVRLSVVAMTPPLLLDAVFGLLLKDQMHVLLFLGITVAYQVFAIKSIKQIG